MKMQLLSTNLIVIKIDSKVTKQLASNQYNIFNCADSLTHHIPTRSFAALQT